LSELSSSLDELLLDEIDEDDVSLEDTVDDELTLSTLEDDVSLEDTIDDELTLSTLEEDTSLDGTVEDILSLVVLVITFVDVDSGKVHTIVLELCALLLNEEFDITLLTFSLDSLTLDELLTLLDEDVLFPHPTNEIKANTVNIFLFIKITSILYDNIIY